MISSRFTSPVHASARFVAQRLMLRPLVWSLTTARVHGAAELTSIDGPFIVVANHSSHLDAPLVMGALPRPRARYIAAAAAADYFFDVKWRKALTALFFNAFPVDRTGTGARSGLARELLDSGVPLLIFPQGGRSRTEHVSSFKAGAAALSMACGVPCVPTAIVGASFAMPRGKNWPVRGRKPVAVVFGAPLRAEPGETAAAFTIRLHAAVRDMHDSHVLEGETVTYAEKTTEKESR